MRLFENVLVGAALAAGSAAILAPTTALAYCPQCFDAAGHAADVDALNQAAGDLKIQVTYPYGGGPAYFPITTIDPDGVEGSGDELVTQSWCIDLDHTIGNNTWYCANLYSSYEIDASTGLDDTRWENLDIVNWILNQDFVGTTASDSTTYTYGDVQRTIWSLVDDTLSTGGLGSWSQARVDEILAAAAAAGLVIDDATVQYEPPCDGIAGVIIEPTNCATGEAQILIAQILVAELPSSCGDCPCDTTQPVVVGDFGMDCQTLLAGQTIDAGTVCTEVVGDDLVVTYTTTGGWELTEAHLWVGANSGDYPQNKKGNPIPGQFPNNSGDITGATEYSFSIPLADLGIACPTLLDDQYFVAAHAAVRRDNGDGTYQTETGWGDGDRFVSRGNWGTYDDVTFTCECPPCDEPPVEVGCETAFAYASIEDGGTCFLDIDVNGDGVANQQDLNRWGWTIQITASGMYDFPIYAGAGQCDLTKGTLVGNLHVEYDGTVLIATYEMAAGYKMDEVHFYAGNEILPRDNGEFTVAPGQYPNIAEDLAADFTTAYTWEINWDSGDFYIVAHAVVCGDGLGGGDE